MKRKLPLHWGDMVDHLSRARSPLVMGVDPVFEDIPKCFRDASLAKDNILARYVSFILEAGSSLLGFVKFQSAFFEAFGSRGISVLASSIARARGLGYGIILDAKRGDIESTATAYARAYLTPSSVHSSDLEVDCMTINPFLGPETLEPFVTCAEEFGKGLFILVKTSNPGAAWLQDLRPKGKSISEIVAEKVGQWAQNATGASGLSAIGGVVGVTYPKDGRRLREILPSSIFLAPGLGAQGGHASDLRNLQTSDKRGVLIAASRAITKPSRPTLTESEYGAEVQARIVSFIDQIS